MKLHKFDSLSFVAGAIMVVLGLIFLIPANPTDIFDGINDVGAWLWPTLFLMVAGAVLIPILFPGGSQEEDSTEDASL